MSLSTSMRKHGWKAQVITACLTLFAPAALTGCGARQDDGLEPLYDLTERFEDARTIRDGSFVDVGSSVDRRRLLEGWSGPENDGQGTTFSWATGREASVSIDATGIESAILEVRCLPYGYEGAPPQIVSALVNGTPVGEAVLEAAWATYRFDIPDSLLSTGENTVTFRFAHAASPSDHGGSDGRTLAAAFDFVRVLDARSDQPWTALFEPPTLERDRIVVPAGTTVVFTLPAPRDGVLELSVDKGIEGLAGEVWLAGPDGASVPLLAVPAGSADRGPFRVPLGVDEGDLVDIGFETTFVGPADGRARLGWISPRIYGRRTAEPVTDVVLIVVDTLRADHVGAYGSDVATPNIDRLAASGVLFENAYSHIPITGPSHATLFTSLAPFEHGVLNNAQIFDPSHHTMAELLGGWARRTAGFVSLGVLQSSFKFDQGFDAYYDRFDRDWMKNADEVNAEVMTWLGDNGESPFFAWIHYSDPHEPYAPPGLVYPSIRLLLDGAEVGTVTADGRGRSVSLEVPPGVHTLRLEPSGEPPRHRIRFPFISLADDRLEMTRGEGWTTKTGRFRAPAYDTRLPATLEIANRSPRAVDATLQLICRELLSIPEIRERYALEVEFVDRRIGELLDELDRRGVLDSALVIFASDHGEGFGEHNHVGHISQLYEQLIRVPLIISFPSRLPAGARVEERVGLVDVLPTVAELLDVRPPARVRGRSLVPLIERREVSEVPLLAETYRPEAPTDKRAVIADGFKLIRSVGEREWEELYDLRSDPGETDDLISSAPEVADRLRELLRSQSSAVQGTTHDADLTEDEKEQLRALGYIR